MENERNATLDLTQLFRTYLQKWWLILLAAVLGGAIGFGAATYLVEPTYSSSVTLYVNNTKNSDTISSADLTASQSLVKTYCEILNNRSTLEQVITRAQLPYTYRELALMVSSGSLNGTEVMQVTVTCNDPDEASKIANCIAEVLPIRISAIINGATMEVVDSAIPNRTPVSPSKSRYLLVGVLLGGLLSVAALSVAVLTDGTIRSGDQLLQELDCPILATVPDLAEPNSRRYGYGYGYGRYGRTKRGEEEKK